eukprot:COSAG06_NODE_1570_length_9069_cov_2.920067_1_plen_36_part_00
MSFVNQGNYNDACQYYLRYETQRNQLPRGWCSGQR